MRTLMVLLLMMVAGTAPAQTVVKCTQADGSVAYQQTACAGGAQEQVDVYAPPPPTPVRRMVQAFDPVTGAPTEMWIDGPAPSTAGATYTTREMKQVFDPATGVPHEMWVDVEHPVPQEPRARRYAAPQPRMAPRARGTEHSYYQPGAAERRQNAQYEKARCQVVSC